MISVRFQGKPFNITVIHVHAPTSNAEEAEVERFYEDLQDLSELTHTKKDLFFIIGDWNAKVVSQETPGGKFGLGVWNKAGQKTRAFCQENVLVRKQPLPTTKEKSLHMGIIRWSTMKSN